MSGDARQNRGNDGRGHSSRSTDHSGRGRGRSVHFRDGGVVNPYAGLRNFSPDEGTANDRQRHAPRSHADGQQPHVRHPNSTSPLNCHSIRGGGGGDDDDFDDDDDPHDDHDSYGDHENLRN